MLELLHEVGGVGGAFLVGCVEAPGDDSLHHVEAHWARSVLELLEKKTAEIRTPVGDDGLEALQLGRPFRKGGKLQAFELGGDCVCHGLGCSRGTRRRDKAMATFVELQADGRRACGHRAGSLSRPAVEVLWPSVSRELQSQVKDNLQHHDVSPNT